MWYIYVIIPSNNLGCLQGSSRFISSTWFNDSKRKFDQELFGCHHTSSWNFPNLFELAWSKEKDVWRFRCHHSSTLSFLHFKQFQRGVGNIYWCPERFNCANTSLHSTLLIHHSSRSYLQVRHSLNLRVIVVYLLLSSLTSGYYFVILFYPKVDILLGSVQSQKVSTSFALCIILAIAVVLDFPFPHIY